MESYWVAMQKLKAATNTMLEIAFLVVSALKTILKGVYGLLLDMNQQVIVII